MENYERIKIGSLADPGNLETMMQNIAVYFMPKDEKHTPKFVLEMHNNRAGEQDLEIMSFRTDKHAIVRHLILYMVHAYMMLIEEYDLKDMLKDVLKDEFLSALEGVYDKV